MRLAKMAGDGMAENIDLVQFGIMIQTMRSLEKELVATRVQVSALEDRLSSIESRVGMGKASIAAFCIGLAFALFGIKATVVELWNKL